MNSVVFLLLKLTAASCVLCGRHTGYLFERLIEADNGIESACIRDLCDRFVTLAEHLNGAGDTQCQDIVVGRHAIEALEGSLILDKAGRTSSRSGA